MSLSRGSGLAAHVLPALFIVSLLAACGPVIPEAAVSVPPVAAPVARPETALVAGLRPGPVVGGLRLGHEDAAGALASFVESCPRLLARNDASGLTRGADWQPACTAAKGWAKGAHEFFVRHFEAAQVSDGSAHVTGYYEPEIAGVRKRQPGFDVPVYGLPPDLVRARPGDAPPLADGRQPLGRYDADGRFVAYFDRSEIEGGALMGRGLEIAWAADPVEFFFLQVQGSGRLRAPDGRVMHVGYAGQNGRPYTGIGALMRERGLVGEGPGQYPGSMQGIMQYLRDRPEEGRALMLQNRSFVFFRETPGADARGGPVGALGVPVRAGSSVAADPRFVPLGAPVWLELDRREAGGLWIAQDTGGAIKGANRFDSFWGAGEEARRLAGGMSARGRAYVLLPKGTLQRLGVR